MSQAASITVAVRVRPPNEWEADRLPSQGFNDSAFMGDGHLTATPRSSNGSLRPIVQVMDDKVLIFDPKDPDVSRAFEQKGFAPPGTKRYKDHRYTFDRIFNEDARQIDVYENTTRPLLDGLLDGFNATVFAYGATGCGKTHTISGTASDPGIIYLTMAELFQKIGDMKDDIICDVTLSFLEIYNEEIRDLLAEPGSYSPKGGLAMRKDKSNRIIVSGLTERCPTTAAEVEEMVLLGNSRRTQSPTHANETSSRSHAVLQVNVTQTPRTASTTEERTMATLSIIDLAGSERASATKNMGERMVEGANINKSLLALGNCINALCESGGRTRHIPYRNSKLTRLLEFSLGGNCKTVMIVCIAPASNHFEDTQNTLKYANRAKDIKTKVSRNFINVDRHVAQYVEAINRLNDEVAELKAKLSGKLNAEGESAKRRKLEAKIEVEKARADIASKFDQTQESLIEGATSEANLFASQTRLHAIRNRLHQLDEEARKSSLPADLLAEQGLLRSLAMSDEALTHPHSSIHSRLQKSGNANAMFEATLRAVSERRSEKYDDLCVETVRTDARYRRAEMDRLRALTREAAYREALSGQATVVADLVGILARCTVMMSDGGRLLRSALEEASDDGDLQTMASTVANSLVKVAQGNDDAFIRLVGQATASFTAGKESSLRDFAAHAPGVKLPQAGSRTKHRRSSINNSTHSPPSRKLYKSPRKPTAFRQSFAKPGLPPPPPEYVPAKKQLEKKSLRWKDEAGEGDLDDKGAAPAQRSASAPTVPESAQEMPAFGLSAPSKKGSESENEWEDEKTDDSMSSSFFAPSSREREALSQSVGPPIKRARNSRLKPDFLMRSVSALGSLGEESEEEAPKSQKPSPLSERSNQITASSSIPPMPRHQENAALEYGGSSSRTYARGTPAKPGRRISNIGPVRVEKKSRRRSSLIPRLPPPPDPSTLARNAALYGPPKRMLIPDELPRKSTPGRKKRLSLTGSISKNPLRPAFPKSVVVPLSISPDPNLSMAFNTSTIGKPTWR